MNQVPHITIEQAPFIFGKSEVFTEMCMKDVTCPYCAHDFDICHDDGHGMDESSKHEEECPECEKMFVFETYISINHTAYKADCLNGSEHQLKLSKTWPMKFAKMRCKDCDYERQPTAEENPL